MKAFHVFWLSVFSETFSSLLVFYAHGVQRYERVRVDVVFTFVRVKTSKLIIDPRHREGLREIMRDGLIGMWKCRIFLFFVFPGHPVGYEELDQYQPNFLNIEFDKLCFRCDEIERYKFTNVSLIFTFENNLTHIND